MKPSEKALELKLRIWQNGLKQRQVADGIGIREAALSDYLLGRRKMPRETLADIEAYLTEMEEAVCER